MNDPADFSQLDELLENSAQAADRGFSQRMQRKLNRPALPREVVFIALGGLWLCVAAVSWSPEFVAMSFSAFADAVAGVGGFIGAAFMPDHAQAPLSASQPPGMVALLPALALALYQFIGYWKI